MRTQLCVLAVLTIIVCSGCSPDPPSSADQRQINETLEAAPVAGSESLPQEIVGVWGSPDAKFRDGVLLQGGALYVGPDGFAAMVGAPPPIGMAGSAAYDPGSHTITLDLDTRDEPERLQVIVIYNPETRQLKTVPNPDVLEGTFTRHLQKIPKSALEVIK